MGNVTRTEQEILNATYDEATGAGEVTLVTGLNPTDDVVTSRLKTGTPVNLSASGQILAGPGQILGFRVNTTGGGTVRLSNALTATTPYLGAAMTPAVGYHEFPSELTVGGYATLGGTIDVTFFVNAY